MSLRNQPTIVHLGITTPGLSHNEGTTGNTPAQLTIPPNEFIMVANTDRHLPNIPIIAPALGDLNSPVGIPPYILFQTCGSVLLPDYVDFQEIEMIFYDDWVEEDGADQE